MKITRKFTKAGTDPFASVTWTRRSSRISNPDGSVVFEMKDAEVPERWTQLATDIMVSKYFRKAGVPRDGGPNGIADPDFGGPVRRTGSSAKGKATSGEPGSASRATVETGPERSARQVIHRLAGCWRHWGESHGYFDAAEDAQAFEDELKYMLVNQIAAPNSPQWFNTGLEWAYGINGPAQGHFYADPKTGAVRKSEDAYTHPQPHACFIQSVADDLVNEGGIMDLWVREARLFKYGSGTGTNFSALRGENERLSGGGKSSGLMSWLKIGDRAAGAIKSGGTTRRAAKMVCLNLDHPDIEKFINWKAREELKVAALVEGMKHLDGDKKAIAEELGLILTYDFNGEAYYTVSGQNANNSVRIPDEFFEALDAGKGWDLTSRTTGEVARTVDASELWGQLCRAAWRCADPGVQYDSTINAWHTCPASGRINASNPCSEYMFLDNTACNLASINLLRLYNPETRTFDAERYEHAIDLWTIVLEISVLMAQYPSKEIAELSYHYRTLGLGYANIGAMLMQGGVAYDSDEARAVCGALTAILTGRSYRMSALMAGEHGPFPGYKDNRAHMLRVIRNHRRAAHGVERDAKEWEDLTIRPVPIDHAIFAGGINIANAPDLLKRATGAWDDALKLGESHGYRNAQTTVIAPTGTIGLLMDCDTTGVEPDFALVKFKKLAGGGYFKIANQSVRPALKALGYTDEQVRAILIHVLGTLSLDAPMPNADGELGGEAMTFAEWLTRAGLEEGDLRLIADALPGVFELQHAFNAWSLGDAALERLGIDPAVAKADMSFNLLRKMGLTQAQVDALNLRICGAQTIEGAPQLRDEHLPVFDCANRCGKNGTRFIAVEGHIRMMAAAQPFISGAISKTINLPAEASVEEIASAYRLSWELGLKANALYRDGSKLSQPLSTKSESASEDDDVLAADEDDDAIEAAREEVATDVFAAADSAGGEDLEATIQIVEKIVHRPMRRRLPDTRRSITHKFNIAGHEGYLTVGLYDDGLPGELFITMAKEGSTIGGVMDSLGTAVSVALQYGVPVSSLVKKFTHQRFEPAGMTTNRDIPFAKSLVDYIFRWMGMQFIEGYREENAPKRSRPESGSATKRASADRSTGVSRISLDDSQEGAPTPTPTPTDRRRLTDATPTSTGESAKPRITASAHSREEVRTVVANGDPIAGGLAGSGFEASSASSSATTATGGLNDAMRDAQADAPACDECGTITVRNGTCYRCLNCGHSMGCS